MVLYAGSTDTITIWSSMRRCSGLRSHVVQESVAPVRALKEPLLHREGSYSVVVGLKEALGILVS